MIFLFFCESGNNTFQQRGKVAFLSTLREGLLCPLNIPVKDRNVSGAVHNNALQFLNILLTDPKHQVDHRHHTFAIQIQRPYKTNMITSPLR